MKEFKKAVSGELAAGPALRGRGPLDGHEILDKLTQLSWLSLVRADYP